ncbi:MAG: hypothetical protein M4579_006168 [Chaenotheca gracillima]|nr:MAG: hypothetical protein M4579_006168 [Chaenotheca gracillima]
MLDFDIKEQFLVMRQALAPLQLSRWQMTKLLVAQIFRQMSTTQLIIIAAPFVLLTAYFLDALFRRRPKVDLPLVGGTKDHTNDFQAVVEEGRRLYPHTPYLVQASGVTYVVFPATAWDEIKRLPQSVASTQEFFRIMLYGDYTNIGTETDALIKTIGVDLARGVPLKVHRRQQDCQKAFDTTIGHCPEWKPVTILMAMFNIIATMNACSFVGRELGESDTWVKTVQRFPIDPKHWEKPDVYDDLRHFNLRHKDGNDSRHLFVTTGPDSPNFGDGTQSCPGRLFASSTIKIALTYMLLNYDIKLKDGEGRPKKVSMPNGSWAPDFKADVLFKSRRAEESFYVS